MNKINILDASLADKIAAGEVVERPSSVIKELVENSIDAKASKIEIFVVDGGRTLIEVKDNGVGMSREDARLCIKRHATSKIRFDQDLFCCFYFMGIPQKSHGKSSESNHGLQFSPFRFGQRNFCREKLDGFGKGNCGDYIVGQIGAGLFLLGMNESQHVA